MKKLIVVAFGGNALLDNSGETSFQKQYQIVSQAVEQIVDLSLQGFKILIVHGNGPQVGFALRRSELAQSEVAPLSLDYAVAESQGSIGLMLQQNLHNAFQQLQLNSQVVSLVTQIKIDPKDPAFLSPNKPIGSFFGQQQAEIFQQQQGWHIMEDAGRGWRRCVASPMPQHVIELPIIRSLLEQNCIVIAGGGGGVAVIEDEQGKLTNIEAVIDKDRVAALFANQLGAEYLLIPTAVPQVSINFGKPDQQNLAEMTIAQAQQWLAQNQFGKGSMQPKVEALIDFVQQQPNGTGIITMPQALLSALEGKAGTRLLP